MTHEHLNRKTWKLQMKVSYSQALMIIDHQIAYKWKLFDAI